MTRAVESHSAAGPAPFGPPALLAAVGLTALLLAGFWVEAVWDIAHPPVYMSPWGPIQSFDTDLPASRP